MRAVFRKMTRNDSETVDGTPVDGVLVRSREHSLYTALVLLPFLLVFNSGRMAAVLALTSLMLVPCLIGWFVARRGFAVEARLLQVLVALMLVLAGLLSGFGAGLCLALAFLVLVEPLATLSSAMVTRVLAPMVVTFGMLGIGFIANPVGHADLAGFYLPACLAIIPLSIQLWPVLKRSGDGQNLSPSQPSTDLEAAMVSASDACALVVDRSGRVLSLGPNASRVLGPDASDLLGRGLFERLHLLDRPALLKRLAEIGEGDRPTTLAMRLRLEPLHPEARLIQFSDWTARMLGLDAERIMLMLARSGADRPGLVLQVSERVLDGGVSPDERVGQAVRFASLSHMVRTPLNGIVGFGELLADPARQPRSPGAIAEFGEAIVESARSLTGVVEIMTDLLRLQAGSFVLRPEPVAMNEVMALAQHMLTERLGDRCPALEPGNMPERLGWTTDQAAAGRMLGSLALVLAEMQPAAQIRVDTNTDGESVLLTLTSLGLSAAPMPAGAARTELPQPIALLLDLAGALARYQGGSAMIDRLADGNLHAALRLPSALDLVAPNRDPLRLDDFRPKNGSGARPQQRMESVRKHA